MMGVERHQVLHTLEHFERNKEKRPEVVMVKIAPTADRVESNTSDEVNERIRRETNMRVEYFARHPEKINDRLDELDREWDVERTLEANASALTLTGLTLAAIGSRKWLLLSMAVQGFFMQHAMQGWCPPLPAIRRLGFRTADEITHERHALLALRDNAPGADELRGSHSQQKESDTTFQSRHGERERGQTETEKSGDRADTRPSDARAEIRGEGGRAPGDMADSTTFGAFPAQSTSAAGLPENPKPKRP